MKLPMAKCRSSGRPGPTKAKSLAIETAGPPSTPAGHHQRLHLPFGLMVDPAIVVRGVPAQRIVLGQRSAGHGRLPIHGAGAQRQQTTDAVGPAELDHAARALDDRAAHLGGTRLAARPRRRSPPRGWRACNGRAGQEKSRTSPADKLDDLVVCQIGSAAGKGGRITRQNDGSHVQTKKAVGVAQGGQQPAPDETRAAGDEQPGVAQAFPAAADTRHRRRDVW